MDNDKEINPTREYKLCKHLCTQHRSTQIYKANGDGHRGKDWQ